MASWEGQFDPLLNREAWFDEDYAADGLFGEDWVKTVGTGGTAFNQAVSGTLSFTSGLVSRSVDKVVSGTLSFAGSAVRQISKMVSGGLSFSAMLSAIKSGSGTVYNQAVAGTLSFAGGIQKATEKSITGALAFSGGLAKQTGKLLAGTLSFAGVITTNLIAVIAAKFRVIGSAILRVFK